MEVIREWWGVIVAFLLGAVWIGKIQRDVENLKDGKFVTNERCGERRQEIKDSNVLQFASGDRAIIRLERLVSDNATKSELRHSEIMAILFELSQRRSDA